MLITSYNGEKEVLYCCESNIKVIDEWYLDNPIISLGDLEFLNSKIHNDQIAAKIEKEKSVNEIAIETPQQLACFASLGCDKPIKDIIGDKKVVLYSEDIKDCLVKNFDYVVKIKNNVVTLFDCVRQYNASDIPIKEFVNQSRFIGYHNSPLERCLGAATLKVAFCPHCKTFIPMHYFESNNNSIIMELYKKDLACPKCHKELPELRKIIPKYNVVSEIRKDPLPLSIEFSSYYLEESTGNKHMCIKGAFIHNLMNVDTGKILKVGTSQCRVTFDLCTGRLYYIITADMKAGNNRHLIDITNTFSHNCLRGFQQREPLFNIPTEDFKAIFKAIRGYYKEKFPETEALPDKYFLEGVDFTLSSQSILEVMRLVQYPLLSSQMYLLLRNVLTILHLVAAERHFSILKVTSFLRKCREDRFHVTDATIKKFFGFKSVNTSPTAVVVKYLLRGRLQSPEVYSYFIKSIEKPIAYLSVRDEEKNYLYGRRGIVLSKRSNLDTVVDVLGKIYCILGKSNLGYYLFKRYFKETAGCKDTMIEGYIKNLIYNKMFKNLYATPSWIGDALEILHDTFRSLEEIYMACTDKEVAKKLEFTEAFPEVSKLKTLPALPKEVVTLLHRLIKTKDIDTFHDGCTAVYSKLSLVDREITYSQNVIEHLNKHTKVQIGINGIASDIEIKLVNNTSELRRCTQHMHNCVITYYRDVLDSKCIIALLVNNNFPTDDPRYYEGCIEIVDYKVRQIKGKGNKTIRPCLKDFVREWMNANNLKCVSADLNLKDEEFIEVITGKNPYEHYIEEYFRLHAV